MTTLALYSNKGGVGKTAAAVNLGYLAAQSGRSTLVCDLDPQASATFYFRVKPKLKGKARGLTENPESVDASIKGTDFPRLDLLPADFTHRNLDAGYGQGKGNKQQLAALFAPLRAAYDLLIIDCPPSIGALAENIFHVSDYLLTPLVPTTLSLRTHAQVRDFLQAQAFDAVRLYTFFSMVDRRKKMHRTIVDEVLKSDTALLPSPIPYSATIEQMGLYRLPVAVYAPTSAAANAYQALWHDIERQLL